MNSSLNTPATHRLSSRGCPIRTRDKALELDSEWALGSELYFHADASCAAPILIHFHGDADADVRSTSLLSFKTISSS